MGGMNYYIELCFEDSQVDRTDAEIQLNITPNPPRLYHQERDCNLRFLERIGVAFPRMFDYALEDSDNGVGVGYILMEKLPGKPLSHTESTQSGKRQVTNQLVYAFSELRNYLFDEIGSFDTPGTSHVGPMTQ